MQKKVLLILFLGITSLGISQKNTKLKGQIVNATSNKALSAAHILNLNTVLGTITNEDGRFEIATKANDTILVSYLPLHR